MMSDSKAALVVGAGISGLTAAYRLQQQGWQVKVLEASARPGGRAATDSKEGYLIDTGASALATSYSAYIELANELGLGANIVDASSWVGIPRDGTLYEFNVQKMLSTGLTSKWLSWSAKLKMVRLLVDVIKARHLLDYGDMGKTSPIDTESARDYSLKYLGQELNDYLTDALARVMVIADGDKVSKVELFSAVANIFGTQLQALRGGVGSFSAELARRVPVSYGCEVTRIRHQQEGVAVSWVDPDDSEQSESFDGCVVACPLPQATAMCEDYQSLLSPLASALDYTSAITVAVGCSVKPNTKAFAIPLPAVESPEVALLFMDHNKSSDRSPEGSYLINSHWETGASKANFSVTDEELVDRTLQAIYRWFPEVEGYIEMTHVARWEQALPQTATGAYKAIAEFNRQLPAGGPVQFAGDYMSAAGQNTAVAFGNRAARNLLN